MWRKATVDARVEHTAASTGTTSEASTSSSYPSLNLEELKQVWHTLSNKVHRTLEALESTQEGMLQLHSAQTEPAFTTTLLRDEDEQDPPPLAAKEGGVPTPRHALVSATDEGGEPRGCRAPVHLSGGNSRDVFHAQLDALMDLREKLVQVPYDDALARSQREGKHVRRLAHVLQLCCVEDVAHREVPMLLHAFRHHLSTAVTQTLAAVSHAEQATREAARARYLDVQRHVETLVQKHQQDVTSLHQNLVALIASKEKERARLEALFTEWNAMDPATDRSRDRLQQLSDDVRTLSERVHSLAQAREAFEWAAMEVVHTLHTQHDGKGTASTSSPSNGSESGGASLTADYGESHSRMGQGRCLLNGKGDEEQQQYHTEREEEEEEAIAPWNLDHRRTHKRGRFD